MRCRRASAVAAYSRNRAPLTLERHAQVGDSAAADPLPEFVLKLAERAVGGAPAIGEYDDLGTAVIWVVNELDEPEFLEFGYRLVDRLARDADPACQLCRPRPRRVKVAEQRRMPPSDIRPPRSGQFRSASMQARNASKSAPLLSRSRTIAQRARSTLG